MRFLQKIKPKDIILSASLVVVALLVYFSLFQNTSTYSPYVEVGELSVREDWSFQELSTYFQQLADKKGAEYAFEVLRQATLPTGTDLHLLAHVVGDMLYKQKGIKGIQICTPDFRNACSHSVVIGILNDKGEGALPEIAQTCKEAPGGSGAYTMCFHGLGHGVLAYNGYNFEKAVEMCKKTGTAEYSNREYIECVGGATMEMIAGVHDTQVWESQVGNYFKKEDPLYPCDAPFMPDEVKSICLVYLTPHLFTLAGLDLGNIDSSLYAKAFASCNMLPIDATEWRKSCYGGFGKEFVVLAQGRDVRDIGSMAESSLREVRGWCSFAGDSFGESACNASALSSLFWGGESNPDASFTYCQIASDETVKNKCYIQLSDAISFYLSRDARKYALCARLPVSFQKSCVAKTL